MKRIAAILILTCLAFSGMSAQDYYTRFDGFIRKIMTTGLDSDYIAMSQTSWEIPTCVGSHGQNFSVSTADGIVLHNKSGNVCDGGIGLGYHGLDFIWKRGFGENKDYFSNYFEFDFYDNYWGFQMITTETEQFGAGLSSATYGGYFAFNGDQYSYPAAIYGNYVQKRSAGSPMLFFWYDRNSAWGFDALSGPLTINNFSLCGGYGYNFALNEGRTLFNMTAVAGIIVPYWGVSAQARFSFIHWFNDYVRINASAVQYASAGWKNSTQHLLSTDWTLNFGLTFCFGKLVIENL